MSTRMQAMLVVLLLFSTALCVVILIGLIIPSHGEASIGSVIKG